MAKPVKKIVAMELPMPSMGRQIPYEIYYGKKLKDHKEVEISVSLEDSIHWFCRKMKFRVLSVHPDYDRTPNAPEPLFYRLFPKDNPEFAFHVNSGPARAGTEGNWYKPIFEFDDNADPEKRTKLDPHIKT